MGCLDKFREHSERALNYAQRALKLDVRYFMRGGFWLSLMQGITTLTGFLVVVAFTRLATKDFYGQYQFIMAIIAFLAIFSLPGMQTAITQAVSRNKNAALLQGTKANDGDHRAG